MTYATTNINNDTVIAIDKDVDGYDVNIPKPTHLCTIESGMLNHNYFVGTFSSYPKALAAAYDFCAANNLNPIEVI